MADQTTDGADDQKKEACTFFKPRQIKGNLRKRKAEDENEDPDASSVVVKQKDKKENPLIASTKELKKKKDDLSFASLGDKYAGPRDGGATMISNLIAEKEHGKQGNGEEVILTGDDAEKAAKSDEKVYKGMKNYTEWIEHKEQFGLSKGTGIKAGPIRGFTYHRAISRIDYQPDVCKDYKETGYCSFGDSCKFMHDRGDYKQGWEIEKEWEEEQKLKEKQMKIQMGEEQPEEESDVPFACSLCREYFTDPVKTKCKHFFCERCALNQYAESPKCATCGENTNGSFLRVSKAEKQKLDKAKEIEEKRRAKAQSS